MTLLPRALLAMRRCPVCSGPGRYRFGWSLYQPCTHCGGAKVDPPASLRGRVAHCLKTLGSSEDTRLVRRYIAALEAEVSRLGGEIPEEWRK